MPVKDYGIHVECLSTEGFPARPAGWFLKHVDTGETYYRYPEGWVLEGLGVSLAPLVKAGVVITNDNGIAAVVFGTRYIDVKYGIQLTCKSINNQEPRAVWTDKSESGFSIRTVRGGGGVFGGVTVDWVCSRYYNE